MKVLLTTPTFPPFNSGLGNAVYNQARALRSKGVEVVVATSGSQRSHRIDGSSGIKIEEFNLVGSDFLLNPIRGDREGYQKFLIESDFDVIVLHAWQNWATDLALSKIKEIKGKKYLYSHCISTNLIFKHQPVRSLVRYLAWRPYWWRLSNKLKHMDGVIFLADNGMDSRFDDEKLAKKLGVKSWVIPNSLSEEARSILEKKSLGFTERDTLIAVGAYEWQKGFDSVLRIYAGSKAKNSVPLKLFGQKKTSFAEDLQSLADELGIDPGFLSFVDGVSKADLLYEYATAKLCLSGSLTECQPLVLLDANAAGTPFVSKGTGCIPSMPGGVSFQTETEGIQHINQLLIDQHKWMLLSKEGRTAAKEIYDLEKNTDLLMKIIQG
ncbi:MAG: glycosyltransferase family 4 protein [Deltaproteobacteria bacterium]